MKVWVINPALRAIVRTSILDSSNIRDLVGGYIECAATLPGGDLLWVNEEGMLTGKAEPTFRLAGRLLFGVGVVTGPEIDDVLTDASETKPVPEWTGNKMVVRFETSEEKTNHPLFGPVSAIRHTPIIVDV